MLPAFNPRVPVVTPAHYPEDSFTAFLQALIDQAARATPFTGLFGDLPASPYLGQPAVILDSTTNTWGAPIAGGGLLGVLGVWTGAAWTVMGKA